MWKELLFQLAQFFKPFPTINSWAYKFTMWRFTRNSPWVSVPVVGNLYGVEFPENFKFITFEEKANADENNEPDLDIPTYLRNGKPIPPGLVTELPQSVDRNKNAPDSTTKDNTD